MPAFAINEHGRVITETVKNSPRESIVSYLEFYGLILTPETPDDEVRKAFSLWPDRAARLVQVAVIEIIPLDARHCSFLPIAT